MSDCICMGFSINKMCVVHGNPEIVKANEQIRVQKTINNEINSLQKENQDLRNQLEKAEKVIEFYANPNGNYERGITTYTRYVDDSTRHEDAGYKLVRVGKRARNYLKENK